MGIPGRPLLIAVAVAFVLAIAACGAAKMSVTGLVVDVTPQSIDAFAALSVRDDSGTVYTFLGARFPEFTPSHLLEHRIAGAKVKVVYRRLAGGDLEIISIEDG